MWVALELKIAFPPKVLNILRALHKETSGDVRAYGRVSDEFFIKNGVRQGDALAPAQFN